MQKALEALDVKLSNQPQLKNLQLLMGGGAAFALGYQVPLHTADIDAIPLRSPIEPHLLDKLVKEVGRELNISPDWLNPYFGTFLVHLPPDYGERLKEVFSGKILKVLVLGKEDLMILKCFAGREKDMPHAKTLLKKGLDITFVQNHLEVSIAKKIPGSQDALDFLFEALDQLGM